MAMHLKDAAEALNHAIAGSVFTEVSTPFVCPYPDCRVYAQHRWGALQQAYVSLEHAAYQGRSVYNPDVRCALCEACEREVIWVDSRMVSPQYSEAPQRSADMPEAIHREYDEAASILNLSPRGSAALLRLAVQKLLPILGATKTDINGQIGELVGSGAITKQVAEALDSLRVIGNEAVHPGTIDLNDNREIASSLFILLNYIIEKAISDPKHADEVFSKIPEGKRDGIEVRNRKAREVAKG